MRAPIRFYFDFLSPYAYLAWSALPPIAARHQRTITPVPVLFGGLLEAWKQRGPAEIPPKRVWVFKDALRSAHALGLPFAAPPTHPFNPLLALRACSLDLSDEARRALVMGMFHEVWGGGRGVTAPEVIADVASRAGLDGDEIVRAAQSPDAKARLRAQTENAIAAGVFGVPTMLADSELFWGYDSLAHLDRYLAGDDPATPERMAPWVDMPEGLVRRGSLIA